mmetsp:Transcript_92516/g.169787  ORF Transcript_92516/g.169787 Transcript_92516/m.169787 type:complete len:280 (+) Transcript_92516:88-927(+)
MQTTALLLTCLACVSDGRRVQSLQRHEGNPSEERSIGQVTAKGPLDPMEALAKVLVAFDPAAAFSLSGVGPRVRKPALADSRFGSRAALARMSDESGEEKFKVQTQEYQDPTKLAFRKLAVFFGKVTVGLGPGMKPIVEDFPPSWPDDTSAMASAKVKFPVGMRFQESGRIPGRFEVVEVGEGSNAEKAGIKPGDLIRGVTAIAQNRRMMQQSIEKDVAFSLSGGATGPNLEMGYMRALFVADNQSFDNFAQALVSNKDEQNGGLNEAVFVIERNNPFD